MDFFPKKYTLKDLRKRSSLNKEIYNKEKDKSDTYFTPNILPGSKKLSYKDFFLIYLRDFFDKAFPSENTEKHTNGINNLYEQLFVIYGNQLENIFSSYLFFSKKNQTLAQVGAEKLKRHIISSTKKYLNANHKILDSYSSSNHKIYIPDSDLYVYMLEQFRSLRERGKFTNKTTIGYRSFNLQTSIPLEGISRKEKKIPYYTLKYFIGTKAEALPVYVEDIDFCCGDVALLVHPKDKRYNKHIGKNAIIPLCNRQIPIIGDESVNIAINNGIKRICPFCDEEGFELAKKYGLPTDIYVFDKEGLYTNYIHEPAFIGEKREKYYNNIVGFIEDIGNLAEKGEIVKKIPFLNEINERLVPYKIDQLTIDLQEEKQKIITKIFENKINYAPLSNKISELIEESKEYQENTTTQDEENKKFNEISDETQIEEDQKINPIRQEIVDELNKWLPDSMICNSQFPFGRKLPLIKDDEGNANFFDIEKNYISGKEKPLQTCFNYILLCLIRAGTISPKFSGNDKEYKLCEYNKYFRILSENEKKIEYLIEYLGKITGEKSEYNDFYKIIENLANEDKSAIKDLSKLIKNCKYLKHEGNYLFVNLKGISNDMLNPDFIELCIPCYLESKGIKMNNQIIFDEKEKSRIFKELLIQELLLSKTINNNLIEHSYEKHKEFLGERQLSKIQVEQSMRNTFSIYGEDPIRLNFLIDKTFDQKQILLNNILLKQIRNAVRLCIQKNFLPEDIKSCLNNTPKDFEDFDIIVLDKLKELYNEREYTETYEDYIRFFHSFKESIQNIFFSWYLEIQKVNTTKNVQFVCAYFFNFLLTILYPLTPEFVHALQHISKREFINPIKPLELSKTTNYNMNILYNTFIKIKEMKTEYNIKQHESCNIFIKSNPTICELFTQYEQIFINYFHISDIIYLRLHEQTPLGYEIFLDDIVTIGIQPGNGTNTKEKDSIESIEKDIKNLDDKLILLRQRLQILPEGEDRKKAEEEYSKTKEEIETLTIRHSLLSSK